MTNYSQTLDEIFNILTMYLPIDRNQRMSFVSFYTSVARVKTDRLHDHFDLLMATGQRIATIEVFEFEPPVLQMNTEFAFESGPVMKQFDQYFKNQHAARGTMAKHIGNKQNHEAFTNANEFFLGNNKPKPIRKLDLKDFAPELNIDYGNFKLGPNIPNLGKASL
jgi:hypothetical protein